MTGNEIRNSAEVYVGSPIEDDMALIAINEALTIIGDMGVVYDTMELNASRMEIYELPDDCTTVHTVYDGNGSPEVVWIQTGKNIQFPVGGNYRLVYRKIPKRIGCLDEQLDINDSYLTAIVRFLRSFAIQSEEPEKYRKRQNFESFEQEVLKVYRVLNRTKQPKQIRVIRHA